MDRVRHIFFFITFGLSFFFARGQQFANYITNGSFEEFYSCTGSQWLRSTKGWMGIDSATAWGGLRISVCNGNIPTNGSGYQFPKTGNSCVITTLYNPFLGASRSYLKNRLKQNLINGRVYCVKFYVNITDVSPRGMNGFGAYFGDNTIDTIVYNTIPLSYLIPQVKNPIGNVIQDTMNWVPITGTFVANGTEIYLVLGNFLADNAVTTSSINTPYFPQVWTDVLLDDVSCIELNISAYAGPDKLINVGDSAFIGRQPDFATDSGCIWYKLPNMTTAIDTISGLWVKPTVTSTYVVRQELDCSPVKWDTVIVTINTNLVDLNKLQKMADNITLSPNPTSGSLKISFSGQTSADFSLFCIFNSLGQIMRTDQLTGTSVDIATTDLAPGLYEIHFKSRFVTVTKKFVKTD